MADILTRIDRHNWDVEPEPVRRIVEAAADEIRRLRQEVVSHVVMADVVKTRLRVVEEKLDRLHLIAPGCSNERRGPCRGWKEVEGG